MNDINAVIQMFHEAEEAQWHPWYGIPEIEFRFLNEWADPLIRLRDNKSLGTCSCYIVEDTMWEQFREEGYNNGSEFDDYMRNNADIVIGLTQLALEERC